MQCSFLREGSQGTKNSTLLKVDIACTTSLVNVFPVPEDPIKTVGLINWYTIIRVKDETSGGGGYGITKLGGGDIFVP